MKCFLMFFVAIYCLNVFATNHVHTAVCDHHLAPRWSAHPQLLKHSPKFAPLFKLNQDLLKGLDSASHSAQEKIVEHKILILSATPLAQTPALQAAVKFLGFMGVPYEFFELTQAGRVNEKFQLVLEDEQGLGKYSGIVFTEFNLSYFSAEKGEYVSALTDDQWTQLLYYKKKYSIRAVSLLTYPQEYVGVSASFTGGTQREDQLFIEDGVLAQYAPDLKRGAQMPLKDFWHYPVTIIDNNSTRGLIKSSQSVTDFLASIHQTKDGTEQLHFFFPQHPDLLASRWIAPLWIKWLTENIHLGARQSTLSLQVDDLLIPTHLWSVANLNSEGEVFRIGPTDIESYLVFEEYYLKEATKNQDFKIEMAYNGKGMEDYGGLFEDPLSLNLKKNLERFTWISHTYHHYELDHVSYETALEEVSLNREVELQLNRRYNAVFSQSGIVTPRISGLKNPEVLKALYHAGKKYVIGDNTVADLRPTQKHHLARRTQVHLHGHDGLMIIPRDPNDIFYNVSLPEELASLFNHLYFPNGDQRYSFEQILDKNSDELLGRLLDYDLSSHMFHQANMRHFFYQGQWTSLMSEWLRSGLEKFKRYSTLPIESLDMDQLSERYLKREKLEKCQPKVYLVKKSGVIKNVKLTSQKKCRVPMTFDHSVQALNPLTFEFKKYGPDFIYFFNLLPEQELIIQL